MTPKNYLKQLRDTSEQSCTFTLGEALSIQSSNRGDNRIPHLPRAAELGAGELRQEYERIIAMRHRVSAEMDAEQIRRDEALAAELLEKERAEAEEALKMRVLMAQKDAELALKVASSTSPPPDVRKSVLKRARPDSEKQSCHATIQSFVKRNSSVKQSNHMCVADESNPSISSVGIVSSNHGGDSHEFSSPSSHGSSSMSLSQPLAKSITAWLVPKRKSSGYSPDTSEFDATSSLHSEHGSCTSQENTRQNLLENISSDMQSINQTVKGRLQPSDSRMTGPNSPCASTNNSGVTMGRTINANSFDKDDAVLVMSLSPLDSTDSQETYVHPELANTLDLMPMIDSQSDSFGYRENIGLPDNFGDQSGSTAPSSKVLSQKVTRVCKTCTFENYYELCECEMCGARL